MKNKGKNKQNKARVSEIFKELGMKDIPEVLSPGEAAIIAEIEKPQTESK